MKLITFIIQRNNYISRETNYLIVKQIALINQNWNVNNGLSRRAIAQFVLVGQNI